MKLRVQNYKKLFKFAGYFEEYDENEIYNSIIGVVFAVMHVEKQEIYS